MSTSSSTSIAPDRFKTFMATLKIIIGLIQQERTGGSVRFARRLGVSRPVLFQHLQFLKDQGAEIAYCRRRKTFVLENEFDLQV